MQLTWPQVNTWRLERHHLTAPVVAERMLDVVGDLCALQAQVMSAAELAVGARVVGIGPATVQGALWQERTLVKTWALRGTLHLVPAAELPTYVAAFSTLDHYRKPVWLRAAGITLDELDAIIAGVREALDGRCLTREQLAVEVERVTGSAHIGERMRSGWGQFLKPAAFHGYLCFGPNQGQNVTFVRPDQWLGLAVWPRPDPLEAWATLLRRFLGTYGPATRDEFARWFGLPPGPAKKVIDSIKADLLEVEVEGWKAWALAADAAAMAQLEPTSLVRLLPNFDTYTLSVARQFGYLCAAQHKERVYREAGWVSPVVLLGGRIVGVWKYDKGRKGIDITVELFQPSNPQLEEGIAAEAERIGVFLGGPANLRVNGS